MKIKKLLQSLPFLLAPAFPLFLAGCEDDAGEEAGEAVDEAVDETEDAIEDVGD